MSAARLSRRFLKRNYEDQYHKIIRNSQWLDFVEETAGRTETGNIAIAGHKCWGIEELVPGRHIYYVTMLREPFQRLVSEFRYHQLTYLRHSTDFSAFVDQRRNVCVNWLGDGSLALAKHRLEKTFFFTGILEEFATSLGFIAETFHLPHLYADQLKASKKIAAIDEAAFRDKFYECNRSDMELFDFATALFREKTAGFHAIAPQTPSNRIVINERTPEDLSFVHLPYTDVIETIEKRNLGTGDIQAIISIYEGNGDCDKALDLFDRYIPFHRLCFWRAKLIGKRDPRRALSFLLEAAGLYGGDQVGQPRVFHQSIPGGAATKDSVLHAAVRKFSRKGGFLFFRHILLAVIRKTSGGFTDYYGRCLCLLKGVHHRSRFKRASALTAV